MSGHLIARANVLGVGVSAINMDEALSRIDAAVRSRTKGYVCVTGVHGVMEAQDDPELKRILNGAYLNTPDGVPTVWVGRAQGHSQMRRVYGPDLMLEVCGAGVARGYRHFLFGGNDGVAGELKAAMEKRFPGIQIVGTYTPPFRPLNAEEEAALKAQVSAAKPDLFWVGLSTPKQERFMAKYLSQLDTTLMFGVGAAFDIHTGRIQEPPSWIKNNGLQWAHRLVQEPRRLWRRYLYNNPRFVLKIARQFLLRG